ncbi:hypothetical protein [Janthinobacterium sp. LB2P70]|uniref:hypothetical protein n=1 Tax=Janthinobacterium sp. LB2P70 TaxID=3424197 RepID=UPI003F29BDC9
MLVLITAAILILQTGITLRYVLFTLVCLCTLKQSNRRCNVYRWQAEKVDGEKHSLFYFFTLIFPWCGTLDGRKKQNLRVKKYLFQPFLCRCFPLGRPGWLASPFGKASISPPFPLMLVVLGRGAAGNIVSILHIPPAMAAVAALRGLTSGFYDND